MLRKFINRKRANGEKILSIYLTAGFPTPGATLPLLETIAEAGADIIELGVPFSDPLADGPTIQQASHIALENGITLPKILQILREFKSKHDAPVLLMGYANPFMQFGWQRLADAAKEAGAGGFIIPDLPPEECGDIREKLLAKELSLVFLAAPNTPQKRLEWINRLTDAFIYAVSITGVTGAREQLPAETQQFLQRLRQTAAHPILVGFGISGAESARTISQFCDGVIIGSALIRIILEQPDFEKAKEEVFRFVREIKKALE